MVVDGTAAGGGGSVDNGSFRIINCVIKSVGSDVKYLFPVESGISK